MKLRLIDLIELVLATGCGLALVRACSFGRPIGSLGLRYTVEPFLVGVSIFGMISLARETLANRGREPWGRGRWAWAFAGSVVVIDLLANLFTLWGMSWKQGKSMTAESLLKSTLGSCTVQFYGQVSWMLLVFWVAWRFSGMPRDKAPDGREFAGRVLLGAIILWGFVFRMDQISPWR